MPLALAIPTCSKQTLCSNIGSSKKGMAKEDRVRGKSRFIRWWYSTEIQENKFTEVPYCYSSVSNHRATIKHCHLASNHGLSKPPI
jgi:hypothetical protein